MKLASVLVAAAFVGLSGYTIYTHLGADAGPVAEVVTLPAKRPGVPEPVPAVRTAAIEAPTQVVTQTYGQSQTQNFGFDKATGPGGQKAAVPAEKAGSGSGVAYVSGGVGDDSQDRMASMSREYNLKLMFTLNEGNYLSDVNVAVTDSRGGKVIEDVSNGPFFFAKLPPGQYTVTATYEGKTQTRKVSVGKGMQTAHLRWASTSPDDFPGPHDGPRTSGKVMESRN